jgi:hypothetical protein
MEYALLIYGDERRWASRSEEERERVHAAHAEFAAGLRWDGQLLIGEPLETTSAARTLRRGAISDGPFADTKEQLGGTFVIEVPDLDAAIAWAERAPSALYGDVEIRPTATRFVDGAWTEWTFPGT